MRLAAAGQIDWRLDVESRRRVPFLSRPSDTFDGMLAACAHVWHMQYTGRMSKMIQIRNVPDDVHRELKIRAARAGMSLSDFLNAQLERLVAHRPLDELAAELGHEPLLRRGEAASAVRAGRRG
jgi:plasmid stability protein